jgi:hypothetical protein
MQIWKLGAVLCVGFGATVACGDDDDGGEAAAGTSGGGAGGSSDGGATVHGGTAGRAGAAGNAGNGGATGGTTPNDGGKGGSGGSKNDAGQGGRPEGGTAQGGGDHAGGEADTGVLGGAGGGDSGVGGEGGEGGEGGGGSVIAGPLSHCYGCTRSKIGSPKWEPTGVVAIPSTMPSLEGYLTFLDGLTGPNHAFDENDFIIGPAIAHPGPYNDELYQLAIAKSITPKQTFTKAEFTDPSGVTIMLNIVPSAGAAIGSSFDFASGPIIANSLFPIAVDGDMYREGVMYDNAFDSSYPGYPGMNPPIAKDGPSHLVWFFGENSSFGPLNTPATGSFEFKLKITDSGGAGWNLTVPFTVTE